MPYITVDTTVSVDVDLDDLDLDVLIDYVEEQLGKNLADGVDIWAHSSKVISALKELAALQGEKENLVWLVETVTGKQVW